MFLIQFDACNRDSLGISSIGYVLYYDNTVLWKHSSLLLEAHNSNYAEYKALISALIFALKLNIKYIHIQGDAKIVIEQINNNCQVNSDIVKSLHHTVNYLKNKFEYIKFEHIYRKFNIFADSLANQAIYDFLSNQNLSFFK